MNLILCIVTICMMMDTYYSKEKTHKEINNEGMPSITQKEKKYTKKIITNIVNGLMGEEKKILEGLKVSVNGVNKENKQIPRKKTISSTKKKSKSAFERGMLLAKETDIETKSEKENNVVKNGKLEHTKDNEVIFLDLEQLSKDLESKILMQKELDNGKSNAIVDIELFFVENENNDEKNENINKNLFSSEQFADHLIKELSDIQKGYLDMLTQQKEYKATEEEVLLVKKLNNAIEKKGINPENVIGKCVQTVIFEKPETAAISTVSNENTNAEPSDQPKKEKEIIKRTMGMCIALEPGLIDNFSYALPHIFFLDEE